MKEIIIKFQPFVFKQTVFIKDKNGIIEEKQVPQKELASFISLLPDLEKVHLFGNEKFAEKIREECLTKYNTKEIKILINQ